MEVRARGGQPARTAKVEVRSVRVDLAGPWRPGGWQEPPPGRGGDRSQRGFGPSLLALLEKKLGQPKGGWTNRNLIRAVARVGGFIGRKSDGEPGWQTIWRGWQRLMWMCQGANLIKS